ncbi:MAG: hypothetical protein M1821_005268 [Bathelium mastoideum]|nr:MAG: hypothetical protein M1821_005268 [Bathelium mastoideum]KAI9689163.1 MAG: hypothetical protein M1822_000901 [Bathelium mastoideum]
MKLEKYFVQSALVGIPQLADQTKNYLDSHTGSAAILFHNSNTAQVHVSFDFSAYTNLPTDIVVPGGGSHFFPIPAGISKAGHAFYVGSTPNRQELGTKRDADTKTEFTMNGWSGHAYFDIDVERGVSVPVRATDLKGQVHAGCAVDKIKTCPQAWKHYAADGRLDQCRNPQTQEAISFFRKGCPQWYVASDDKMTMVKPWAKNSRSVLLVVAGAQADERLEEMRKQAKSVLAP